MSIEAPKEEKVMAYLAEILSDLSGVRPGGWTYPRVPTVERLLPRLTEQMKSAELPRLFVVPARSSEIKPSTGRPGIYDHSLNVDIMGVTEATGEGIDLVLADTWRWYLRQDVLETLHLHLTLDGNAKRLDFHSRPEQVDAGELGSKVWFLQPITVFLFATQYETAA